MPAHRFKLLMSDDEGAGFLTGKLDGYPPIAVELQPRLVRLLLVIAAFRDQDERPDENCDPIACGWRSRSQIAAAIDDRTPVTNETVSAYASQIKRRLKRELKRLGVAQGIVLFEHKSRIGIRLANDVELEVVRRRNPVT